MSEQATKLKDQPSGGEVAAVIHDLLTLDALFTAEEQWCVERVGVLRELSAAGIHDARAGWPQSIHWSWARKAATCSPSRLEAFGDVRLFGVEVTGQWQALLYGVSEGYSTHLGAKNRPLVYVDFIEAAPWNWDIPPLNKVGRYRGAGVQLMELAVRWSMALGYDGRIGLHALGQAKTFYANRCGMQDIGPDAAYHNLSYFELTEANAKTFLRSRP
jgi:hypothetical protein